MAGLCLAKKFTVAGSEPEEVVSDENTRLMWTRSIAENLKNKLDAVKFCKDLKYSGFSDWRLPDVRELMTTVDFGTDSSPVIDAFYFPDTPDKNFWTSTVNALENTYSWHVDFKYGETGFINEEGYHFVRCVRGPKLPANNFVEFKLYGDEVVSDKSTNLLWSTKIIKDKNWKEALITCKNMEYGNLSDWRLPNINELYTLADLSTFDPASKFPAVTSNG